MDSKIIFFPPKTASNSRSALRNAVVENAGTTETFLSLWVGIWVVFATVECISQIGLFRLY